MIAYLDSSVLLRIVLRQPGALTEWGTIRQGVASALIEVECLRTLDRLRVRAGIADRELAARREAIFRILDAIEVVEPSQPVLSRAAQPMPTDLGTLDAIHLASALLWRERTGADLVMATHDATLGTAARSVGLRVVGVA
jgi:predicted nucleic acid-binding protein